MNDDLESEIRRRAYLRWERENRPEGKHLEHWFGARTEIEAEQDAESAGGDGPGAKEGQPAPTRRR